MATPTSAEALQVLVDFVCEHFEPYSDVNMGRSWGSRGYDVTDRLHHVLRYAQMAGARVDRELKRPWQGDAEVLETHHRPRTRAEKASLAVLSTGLSMQRFTVDDVLRTLSQDFRTSRETWSVDEVMVQIRRLVADTFVLAMDNTGLGRDQNVGTHLELAYKLEDPIRLARLFPATENRHVDTAEVAPRLPHLPEDFSWKLIGDGRVALFYRGTECFGSQVFPDDAEEVSRVLREHVLPADESGDQGR